MSEWERERNWSHKLHRIDVGFVEWRNVCAICCAVLTRVYCLVLIALYVDTWTSSNFHTKERIKSETSQMKKKTATTTTFSSIPPTVHLTLWPNNNNNSRKNEQIYYYMQRQYTFASYTYLIIMMMMMILIIITDWCMCMCARVCAYAESHEMSKTQAMAWNYSYRTNEKKNIQRVDMIFISFDLDALVYLYISPPFTVEHHHVAINVSLTWNSVKSLVITRFWLCCLLACSLSLCRPLALLPSFFDFVALRFQTI